MVKILHKNQSHTDSMIIGQGHTLMTGSLPKGVKPKSFSENYYKLTKPNKESIQKLGLFGSDIDYNVYYPDLKAEDLKPSESEFITPIFRLLSATIVSKNWCPTDFSQPGVIKDSMKYMLGQTVNCDHSTDIGNAIGSVSEVMWQDPYEIEGGITIPGGMNGVLKIDGKANPRIARGIMMDPPSVHSNSVTVQFKWDKSDPNMDDDEFYTKIGTYDADGNLIRRVVTEIVRYLETSLVSHGADAFAQKIGKDGKIINPQYAQRTYDSYKDYEEDKVKNFYFSDIKNDINSFNDTPVNNNDKNNLTQKNKKGMNEELKQFLEKLFGDNMLTLAEGQEITQENVISCIQTMTAENKELNVKVGNLTTETKTLAEQIKNKDTKIAELTDAAKVGNDYVQSLRDSTVEKYSKLMGDKKDEAIIKMMKAETTGVSTLISLNKDYTERLEEKFPLKCNKCGSLDVSRASSVKEDEDTTKNSEEPEQVKDTQSVLQHMYHDSITKNK